MKNKALSIDFCWEISPQEMDNLSQVIFSAVKDPVNINEDEVTEFLSGILDGLVSKVNKKPDFKLNFEKAVKGWKAQGCSDAQIERMSRGWSHAGRVMGFDE